MVPRGGNLDKWSRSVDKTGGEGERGRGREGERESGREKSFYRKGFNKSGTVCL